MKEDANEKTAHDLTPVASRLSAPIEIANYDPELEALISKCEVPLEELTSFCPSREMPEPERHVHQLICYARRAERSAKTSAQHWISARRDLVRVIMKNRLQFNRDVRPILLDLGEKQSRISELARIVSDPTVAKAYLDGQGLKRSVNQARGISPLQQQASNLIKACMVQKKPYIFYSEGWRVVVEQADWDEQLNYQINNGCEDLKGQHLTPMRKVVY